jgi:hypothetical protein
LDRETHETLTAGVYCEKGKGKNGFRLHRAGENGKLDVKMKKAPGEFIIHIDYGGMYSFMSIPVSAEESTDITVYLESKFMVHVGKGTAWNYKL